MKIDSLLLLAEYFSRKQDVIFCLMYEAEKEGSRALAVYLEPAISLEDDCRDRIRLIETELKALGTGPDLAVTCLNNVGELLRHRIVETSIPIFSRNERLMADFCRRIYRDEVSHNKSVRFSVFSGISMMVAL